jgi:exodeoxyribonuclease VII large subunit
LIVGRGGGSLEDLWAFNEEAVARAIFDSKIPVISAVGHEYDTTIADLVADARASTPTKAGVIAVPDIEEVLEQLRYFQGTLASDTNSKLQLCRSNLEAFIGREVFRRPAVMVYNRQQQADELQSRIAISAKQKLSAVQAKIDKYFQEIIKLEPHRLLGKKNIELINLQNRASISIKEVLNRARIQLTDKQSRLVAMNPKSVLTRGYSITTNKKTGQLVKKSKDISIGDLIVTELAEENFIESKVTNK